MHLRRLLAVPALCLLVAACSDDTVSSGGDGSGGGAGGDAGEPGGLAGDEFIQIDVSGGFVAPGAFFAEIPSVVVYADGTTLVPGAVPAIYPGPAVQPLSIGTLGADDLRELVAEAAEAGLLGDKALDLELPADVMVADAPTTTITIVVDGRVHEINAYALGFTDQETGDRKAAQQFVADVQGRATLAATDLYDPSGYRVLPGEPFDAVDVAPGTLDWPADLPPLVAGECLVLDGDAADAFESLLADANQITTWVTADDELGLSIRPLLPHEDGCER